MRLYTPGFLGFKGLGSPLNPQTYTLNPDTLNPNPCGCTPCVALRYGAYNPANYTDSGVFSRRSAKTFLPHYLKEDVDAVIEAATTGNQECEVGPARCCSRGLHSFRFQLNLSCSVHSVTQLNPECVLELLKLISNVNECKPLCCSRRHRMPSTSRNEVSTCVSMTWKEVCGRL